MTFEYAYAMGHGCSLGWHPAFEVVRREVAELRARLAAEPDGYGESSYGKSVSTSPPSSVTNTRLSSRQPPKPGR